MYGLLPVLTRHDSMASLRTFYDEDFVRAHHLVHAGTSRSPEAALIAVGERCLSNQRRDPKRSSPTLVTPCRALQGQRGVVWFSGLRRPPQTGLARDGRVLATRCRQVARAGAL